MKTMTDLTISKHDYILKELSTKMRDLLTSTHLPWLNSLPYCTGFDTLNPADRVFFTLKNDEVNDVLFYRIKHKFGWVKIIEIEGFPDAKNEQIQELISRNKAHLAVVNRLENAVQPDEEWYVSNSDTYLKSYITIAPLPPSKEEYLNLMGKNKRKQLPQYLRRLHRHFNDELEFCHQTKQEIKLADVIKLEVLNKERRENKGKGVDSVREIEERQTNLMPLIHASGLLITVRHKGEILGGTLCVIHENTAFMLVTGHDVSNDSLRIGIMGIWKTMDYLIDMGIVSLNFLWGRKPYKSQFLGVEYPWTIHIISSQKWLAIVWKNYIKAYEFYLRVKRFLQTRLGLH
jgi:Acetyltransferase (GNAT) domain